MISFDKEKCTGCEMCYAVCPQHVIEMKNHKAELIDYTQCMECGACALNCRYNAISVTKGTGCLFAIIREDILKSSPKGTGCGCGSTDNNTNNETKEKEYGCGSSENTQIYDSQNKDENKNLQSGNMNNKSKQNNGKRNDNNRKGCC